MHLHVVCLFLQIHKLICVAVMMDHRFSHESGGAKSIEHWHNNRFFILLHEYNNMIYMGYNNYISFGKIPHKTYFLIHELWVLTKVHVFNSMVSIFWVMHTLSSYHKGSNVQIISHFLQWAWERFNQLRERWSIFRLLWPALVHEGVPNKVTEIL